MIARTITLVLCYRDPHYGRFQSLVESAQEIPNLQVEVIRNISPGFLRYWQAFLGVLNRKNKTGPVLLGFRGLEFYWLLRFLAGRQPIILDALVSPSLSLAQEKHSFFRFLAPLLFQIEKKIYRDAQHILVDTESHKKFFVEHFALPKKKVSVIPVGAEERLFTPKKYIPSNTFTVLYYFSGQRLHGEEILSSILSSFREEKVHFLLVGPQASKYSHLPNVTAFRKVSYRLLPKIIAQADLCLVGPFGKSPQAERVITTKAYHCLALQKPIVIGENRESSRYFENRINALVVPLSDSAALEERIRWAYTHQNQLESIAQKGYTTYQKFFSRTKRTEQLREVLKHV